MALTTEHPVAPAEPSQNGPSQNVADPRFSRQARIMRQSALERAFIAFGLAGINPVENRDELLGLADQYLEYFVTGQIEK